MTTDITRAAPMADSEMMAVLESSLYPGASHASLKMVLGYCQAAGLDPMQKPVHIVPIWDSKAGKMRDVVMPGIGLYRTQAMRGGTFAGLSEPEFGPDITESIGGIEITYPQWCRVIAKRRLADGTIAEFPAVERWKENYAVKGGKDKSIAPNAMWAKRPYAQLNKCAEAQALRKAFPEFGAQPTAEEMEGKLYEERDITPAVQEPIMLEDYPDDRFKINFPKWKKAMLAGTKTASEIISMVSTKCNLTEEQMKQINVVGNQLTAESVTDQGEEE